MAGFSLLAIQYSSNNNHIIYEQHNYMNLKYKETKMCLTVLNNTIVPWCVSSFIDRKVYKTFVIGTTGNTQQTDHLVFTWWTDTGNRIMM